jgi:oleandomycin transport system ATP-binding protein
MTIENAVEAEGLVKHFGKTVALDGVSFAVPRGRVLGMLGPNGAGKTTAVRILATLLRPDAGSARVSGFDVVHQPSRVRERIGLTGQFASIDEELTGRENLTLVASLLNLARADRRTRATELLGWFDLEDAADRKAKTYSGGMRRRLDLAVSLIGHPEIVFLDEPTTGLDPAKREDMWDVVRAIVSRGTSVLLTTQYLEEAEALADDIIVMHHGKVIAHDTAERLKRVVGSQTLRIRPTRATDVGSVKEALLAVATTPKIDEPRKGEYSVPVAGEEALAATLRRLKAAKIPVTEAALQLPSLDEVFFTLTGEREKGNPTEEGAAA